MPIITLSSKSRTEMIDITDHVISSIRSMRVQNGICMVFCPHTTAGITINENADPDVQTDLIRTLNAHFPALSDYQHCEGNSDAHVKSSLVGASELIYIEGGLLVLGRWQSVYFCEFDGPRKRTVHVRLISCDEKN